jgi:uncharacterized membrane protein YecN with MAPEG domain
VRAARVQPIVAVYALLLAALWKLTGTAFEGETRTTRARRSVQAAFADPPDVELRTPIVMGGAMLATIPTFVIGVVGAVCGTTFGGDPWLRGSLQAAGVCMAWSAVAGLRAAFARHDWERWRNSGRPATWRRSRLATPSDGDLIAFAVLAVVLAWTLGASFDATTALENV